MNKLTTVWGSGLRADAVLQEYPRPSMVRESYLNLNGVWEYGIGRHEAADGYDGDILVPFSLEAPLSGVEHILQPDEYLHYRKKFEIPEGFIKGRVLLHFGAVDQICSVSVNGIRAGGHVGGYLPFSLDITGLARPGENVLTLTVADKTELLPHARGKQLLDRGGKVSSIFYTPQSGIWKTVWLESVPDAYIEDVRITPMFDDGKVEIRISTNRAGSARAVIYDGDGAAASSAMEAGVPVAVSLGDFRPWSPEEPFLYSVEITFGEDSVRSYFGMRKLSCGKDKAGILRFYLNNKPYFFNGVLDQGYWPDGLLTAPSDEALIYDIKKLKAMGYNTIRKHIKIEPERFYYHCDRLGMIVWQDMPNGGGKYNMSFVAYLPNISRRAARHIRDDRYRLFAREDETGRRQYYADLEGMIGLLYSHPCIAAWVLFNEGWGQFDAAKATALARSLDKTRLINEACGWFDQQGGDMYSIHNYIFKLKVKPQKDRVVALTEYGGYAYPVQGHMACEKEFGYKHYRTPQELTKNYERLWNEQIFPNVPNGLSCAIYTQTSDIESEINGLMTYDRAVDKMDAACIQRLNDRLYRLFEELTQDKQI